MQANAKRNENGQNSVLVNKRRRPKPNTINALLGKYATPALNIIPVFDPAIPVVIENKLTGKKTAQTALAMLDAGFIKEGDLGVNAAETIERAFDRWFSDLTGGLKYLSPVICINDNCSANGAISFSLSFDKCPNLIIGERLEDINRKVPGLGETILFRLDNMLSFYSQTIFPSDLLFAGEYLYWWNDGWEEEEEEEEELISKEEFEAAFPDWAISPSKKLTKKKLLQLSKDNDPLIARLANTLSKIDGIMEAGLSSSFEKGTRDSGETTTNASIYTQWTKEDHISPRMNDDWFNCAMENGSDLHGEWTFDATAEGIKKVYQEIENMVKSFFAAEEILDIIAEEVDFA